MSHTYYLVVKKSEYQADPKKFAYIGDSKETCKIWDGGSVCVSTYVDIKDYVSCTISLQNFKKAKAFLAILEEMSDTQKKYGEECVCIIQNK